MQAGGFFDTLSSLLRVLAFVFLIPRRLVVFGGLARLYRMLVLYGTDRAHDERMKSAVSAERAYWTVSWCFTTGPDKRGSLS